MWCVYFHQVPCLILGHLKNCIYSSLDLYSYSFNFIASCSFWASWNWFSIIQKLDSMISTSKIKDCNLSGWSFEDIYTSMTISPWLPYQEVWLYDVIIVQYELWSLISILNLPESAQLVPAHIPVPLSSPSVCVYTGISLETPTQATLSVPFMMVQQLTVQLQEQTSSCTFPVQLTLLSRSWKWDVLLGDNPWMPWQRKQALSEYQTM